MQRDAHALKLQLGDKAPYFSLRGTDGRIYTVADFGGGRGFVVIFTANHCPYAQAYEGRLIELAHEFQPQGVKFAAICSNDAESFPEDNFENMVRRSREREYPFPYLHDETQITAQSYDAACTPETYLFNHESSLVYHGTIDDNHEDISKVSTPYLRTALESLTAGEPIAEPLTFAIGCSIKWKR